MSAPAILTPARRTDLHRLLIRGARDGRVDLGTQAVPNWASIDGFLLDVHVAPNDLAALDRADVEAIRSHLGCHATLWERCEAVLEWLDESGLASALIMAALVIAMAWLFYACLTPVHAEPREIGPTSSTLAGILVALVPVAIAVLFLTFATRGAPAATEDEALGDTTGFGEGE